MLLELPPRKYRIPPEGGGGDGDTALEHATAAHAHSDDVVDGGVGGRVGAFAVVHGRVFSTALDVMDMLQISGGLQMGRDDEGTGDGTIKAGARWTPVEIDLPSWHGWGMDQKAPGAECLAGN